MMMDWSNGVEVRNYRIRRRADVRNFKDLLVGLLCVLLIAGALVGYLWMRTRIMYIGYEVQRLQKEEEALQRTRTKLILQEAVLTRPQRIDYIARHQLGMEPLQPDQRILGFQDSNAGSPAALALAGRRQATNEPKKPSDNYQ
jgi:cell division protein FtsL